MTMENLKKTVEFAANAAILLACCLLSWALIAHHSFGPRSSFGKKEEVRLAGQSIPSLPGYRWVDHRETLILAIRKGCGYCEASLPFYKRLGELEADGQLHAHLLAVMPDDPATGSEELKSSGVGVDGVFSQPLDLIKVTGTPTLLLLDATGRVAQAWVGQLSPQREKEVIAAAER
ncbi:MAG TPA: hypothetical protein VMB18_04165 [Terriglobales bacterium]|nr:hypothetical protein [Terriglobales bacterium]